MPTQTFTELTRSDALDLASETPTLMVIHGPELRRLGDHLWLEPGQEVVIGREFPQFAAEPLMDPRISGKHLRVMSGADGLEFEDVGSKNGTFINSRRVDRGVLQPGAAIQIGSYLLSYDLAPAFPVGDPESLMTGISTASHLLRKSLRDASQHQQAVLLTGAPGVGKELAAREVHRLTAADGPWVAVNCSTLSPQLIEAELFGHEKGAFTGAAAKKAGLFQKADNGTLFLDEIGTLPLDLQPKLLRALQEGKVRPVGSTEEMPCRPRIICASNEDLTDAVNAGRFRADLFSRIHGSWVNVPSLAERLDDLTALAQTILASNGRGEVRLSASLLWAFRQHPWPLNVRSLQQCLLSNLHDSSNGVLSLTTSIRRYLERVAALSPTTLEDGSVARARPVEQERERKTARVARPAADALDQVLTLHEGNVGTTADHFGVRRQQIYRWVEALKLDLDKYRTSG